MRAILAMLLACCAALVSCTAAADAPPKVNVQPGISGAWFDPSKDGQGFIFQVIDARTALTVWYTFDPQGNQAYLVGIGEIQGNRVVMTNLTRSRGGRWGAAFSAAQVVRDDWGDITFTFDTCDRGTAVYSPGASGWPADTLNLQRLTAPRGIGCNNNLTGDSSKFLHGGLSGAWFDPARDGEGWLVEVISADLAVAYWFTYTPDGRQAWVGGLGRIVNGAIIVDQATQPVGGRFGPGFNPAQVVRQPWGSFALTITDCRRAVATSAGPATYPAFDYSDVQQLTSIAGAQPCAFTVGSFALSGSVRAPAGNVLDGDVNDPSTPNRDNDNFQQAQPIGNPAVVQGYATQAATARGDDRFAASADEFDVFSTNLIAGQDIRLAIADHDAARSDAADLDLYLFRATDTANPIATSEGTGPLESLRVPSNGAYFVVVRAFTGKSNYTLAVQTAAAAASTAGRLSALDAMRTDTLVAELEQAPGADAERNQRDAKASFQRLGLEVSLGALGQPLLIDLGTPKQRAAAFAKLGKSPNDAPALVLYRDPILRERFDVLRFAKALRATDGVRSADPNYIMHVSAVPNDPGYRLQWHYPLINLEQAWDLSTGSDSVVAAVLDTGVVPHPDFGTNLRYPLGYDFISSPARSLDGDGIDGSADDPGDRRNPDGSSSFHGTHVGGTMGAASNNGVGVAGVAWRVQLMPVRVLGDGGEGTLFDIVQGMLWAAGLPNASGRLPAQRADVMNLSLGGQASACPGIYLDAVTRARAAGSIVIAAAGNEASPNPSVPAACPGAVSVSAIDIAGRLAPYSNFGTTIDVAAPGGDVSVDLDADGFGDGVLSLLARGEQNNRTPAFDLLQGTSMASPHVAGIVALMKSVNPGLTPAQFDSLLTTGAITIDLANNGPNVRDDIYGYGVIDAFRAVAEARRLATAAAIPPALSVLPGTLDFGDSLTSATLTVGNAGQGALTVTAVSATRPFVSVTPLQVNAQGLGTYTIRVDRAGLAPAAYSADLRVASNAGTVGVNVGLRVGAVAPGSVGTLYVLAIDPVTGIAVRERRVEPTAGTYAFAFGANLPGDYFVFAGSDMDNDGFICDAGESCGGYTSLAQPSRAQIVSANVTLAPFVATSDTDALSGTASAAASSGGSATAGRNMPIRRSETAPR